MYNKVFKNYQVNLGTPFQVRMPVTRQVIKHMDLPGALCEHEDEMDPSIVAQENAEELLEKARLEAANILMEAHLEADRLVENAEHELQERRRILEEEAQRKGYEEGLQLAQNEYTDLLKEAETIKNQATMEYSEILAGIEEDAVDTILAIAQKVIGAEIRQHKEDLLYLVKQAFEKCTQRENIILRASPEDYEYLIENKDRLYTMVNSIGDLEIRRDGSLQPGDCIIDTPFGSVDAGIQTKLDKIEETFRQMIGK